MIEQIPTGLLPIGGNDYTDLVCGMAALKDAVRAWDATRAGELATVSGYSHLNPVSLVRRALSKCPDAVPSPATTSLSFISDAALRDALRLDMSTAERVFTNNEWTAATVIAGSVVEALLLWALKQQPPDTLRVEGVRLVSFGRLGHVPPGALVNWVLAEYIEVAVGLAIITEETAAAARLVKDFRNLIHPGRAQRLGQVCDKGTAYQSLAVLEAVVRDLT